MKKTSTLGKAMLHRILPCSSKIKLLSLSYSSQNLMIILFFFAMAKV